MTIPIRTTSPRRRKGWKRKTDAADRDRSLPLQEDRRGYLGNAARRICTCSTWRRRRPSALTSGDYDERQPVWSPDGTRIAFISKRGADPDRTNNTDIWVVDAKAGATPRQLTTFTGPDGGRPAWSPDGKWIAYLQGDEVALLRLQPEQAGRSSRPPAATPKILTASLDRARRASPVFSTDGSVACTCTVEDDRVDYIGAVPVAGGKVEPVTTRPPGRGQPVARRRRQRRRSTVDDRRAPDEVYALENGSLRKLTSSERRWMSETCRLDGRGRHLHGEGRHRRQRPAGQAGERAGRRSSRLMLYIHGGPNGQDDHSFDFTREILAANGYAVLQVNYRGSSGRGTKFQKAIYADWGNLEVVDLLAGVDGVIKSGVADPDRLGIGGWSYGGILTNYTIATDPRFKAAISAAPAARCSRRCTASTSTSCRTTPRWGRRGRTRTLWMKVSAIRSSTRIGSRRRRCSWAATRTSTCRSPAPSRCTRRSRATASTRQLVIYPGQHHGISMPSYQRDRLERWVGWFDKHLKPGGAAPPATSTATASIASRFALRLSR